MAPSMQSSVTSSPILPLPHYPHPAILSSGRQLSVLTKPSFAQVPQPLGDIQFSAHKPPKEAFHHPVARSLFPSAPQDVGVPQGGTSLALSGEEGHQLLAVTRAELGPVRH